MGLIRSKSRRFKVIASVFFLFIKKKKILMLRRANTGYADGQYSLPAGHVDINESLTEALSRETFEEIGLKIAPKDLILVHVMHRKNDNRLDFFFTTKINGLQPKNMEPDKASDLSWFPLKKLPKNTIPCIRAVINSYCRNNLYSEFLRLD